MEARALGLASAIFSIGVQIGFYYGCALTIFLIRRQKATLSAAFWPDQHLLPCIRSKKGIAVQLAFAGRL